MFWKILFWFFAAMSVLDAAQALMTWDHFGDMHAAWGSNSLIAAGAFAMLARKN